MTVPARSANAVSRSRTAGISFDFASTAACPRTGPMPCASAATKWGVFRAASLAPRGLAVDRDHQPAADLHGPGPQPGTEGLVESAGVEQGEGPAERGLLRCPARRAQAGQHVRAGVGGPPPDRGERPRSCDHRRDPDGEQPGQRVPASASPARVRDLGKEIEQVLAPGSGPPSPTSAPRPPPPKPPGSGKTQPASSTSCAPAPPPSWTGSAPTPPASGTNSASCSKTAPAPSPTHATPSDAAPNEPRPTSTPPAWN